MTGDSQPDKLNKFKTSLKGLFGRSRKSKADNMTQTPSPDPSSITTAPPSAPPAEMESTRSSTDQAGKAEEATTTSLGDTPVSESAQAGAPAIVVSKAPAEGMSATSGPLEDFEGQIKNKVTSETPKESTAEAGGFTAAVASNNTEAIKTSEYPTPTAW